MANGLATTATHVPCVAGALPVAAMSANACVLGQADALGIWSRTH